MQTTHEVLVTDLKRPEKYFCSKSLKRIMGDVAGFLEVWPLAGALCSGLVSSTAAC